jgi:hypothetical protein
MNGFIADNGKLMRAGCYKNQYSVPFRGFVHAQAQEFRLCGSDRGVNVFVADENTDFGRCLVLGLVNRPDNLVVVQMF